jgi:hypothetical protein
LRNKKGFFGTTHLWNSWKFEEFKKNLGPHICGLLGISGIKKKVWNHTFVD